MDHLVSRPYHDRALLTLHSDIFKQSDPLLDAMPCGTILAQYVSVDSSDPR
jgi:hypothetical protein